MPALWIRTPALLALALCAAMTGALVVHELGDEERARDPAPTQELVKEIEEIKRFCREQPDRCRVRACRLRRSEGLY